MESLLPGKLANKPVAERVKRLHYRILQLDFQDVTHFDAAFIQEILHVLVPLFRGTEYVGVIAVIRDAHMITDEPTDALLGMMKSNLFAMAWQVPSSTLYREGRNLQQEINSVVPTRIVATHMEAIDFVTRMGVVRNLVTEDERKKLVHEGLH